MSSSDEAPDELTMTVGVREIYDKVVETSVDVKEIKLGSADHEARIRALERRRYVSAGAAGLASSALGFVVAVWAGRH